MTVDPPRLVIGPLLEYSAEMQAQYERVSSVEERRKKGQFFTPPEVSAFMAGLLSLNAARPIRLLDPGAGVGSLSAAVCDRFLARAPGHRLEIDLVENDGDVLPFLRRVMGRCAEALTGHGQKLVYEIHTKDFILDAANSVFGHPRLFDRTLEWANFDAVIVNPPYFKLRRASRHTRVMADVVHGQPNIYALFLAAAAEMLRPSGELVAITPRSFCGGAYFREFRRWFFKRMALDHLHLFESRTETFREVLQESLVTASHRLGRPSRTVGVTSSFGPSLRSIKRRAMPISAVFDDSCGQAVVRIPTSEEDLAIAKAVESWPYRFSDLGLRVSTGPVVMFRATEFLMAEPDGQDSVPLLSVFNVKPFQTEWPVTHRKHPTAFKVCAESRRLLLPSRNYVLLRRFSAKEESRRLTASCFLANDHSQSFVALENHLNYIYHAERELTVDEVFGLAAIFNSSLLDRYFRTISGNTQVNATDIRNMKFPDLLVAASIGGRVRRRASLDSDSIERLIVRELGINGEIARCLLKGTLFGEV